MSCCSKELTDTVLDAVRDVVCERYVVSYVPDVFVSCTHPTFSRRRLFVMLERREIHYLKETEVDDDNAHVDAERIAERLAEQDLYFAVVGRYFHYRR